MKSDLCGFVKYHRQALSPASTLRKVSRADRATFIDYIALARWRPPFAGCLCDPDGTPWSRERRAQEVGESRTAITRTEDNLLAAKLITFQAAGAGHPAAVGRLHITNFALYQHVEDCPKSDSQGSEIGQSRVRNRTDKGPKSDSMTSGGEGSEIGQNKPQRLIPDPSPDDTISEDEGSEIGHGPGQEVKKVKKGVEGASTHLSLNGQVCNILAPLTGGVGPGLVQTVENTLATDPAAKDVILVAATALAARHADGQKVNIGYLAGNVRDLIERDELKSLPGGAKREADRRAVLRQIDEDNAREFAAQEVRR